MSDNIFNRTTLTKKDKEMMSLLRTLSSESDLLKQNAEYILVRKNTLRLPGNLDTFVIDTSAHPDDEIFYTVNVDVVDLSVKDGGFF